MTTTPYRIMGIEMMDSDFRAEVIAELRKRVSERVGREAPDFVDLFAGALNERRTKGATAADVAEYLLSMQGERMREYAEFGERCERGLQGMSPEQRTAILAKSDYHVVGNKPPYGVMGENGFVSYHDSEKEAEDSIIINTGIFDD